MLASSTARAAAGAGLLLASAASAIPLNLNCVQSLGLALADPELSTCVATEALGSVLPLFFGANNLSLTPVFDDYLEAWCPAPACNGSTVSSAIQNIEQSCASTFESVGLANETLAFLAANEPIFKAVVCVPANATSNSTAAWNSTIPSANSSVASSTMLNGTATNETSLSYCLPSLMSSFETVTGQNVTVQLLAGLVTGNISFASYFPALNSSATDGTLNITELANSTSLGNNETLSNAVCTDCLREMIFVLEDGFANSTSTNATAAGNTTMSLLSLVKAGAEAICGPTFFGNSSANATMPETTSTSLVMPTPIPVSTRSVNMVTDQSSSAAGPLVSSAATAASGPISSVVAAVSSATGGVVSSPASAVGSAATAAVASPASIVGSISAALPAPIASAIASAAGSA